MRRILTLLFLLFCFQVFGQTAENKKLVDDVIKKYNAHKSMSYNIAYMIKYFDDKEPFYINSTVQILKAEKDSIFKAKFVYNRADSFVNFVKYYNPGKLFVIDLKKKMITRFDATQKQISPITGSADGRVLDVYFGKIERLQKKINNPQNSVSYLDLADHLQINIKYPDDEEYHGREEAVFINKTTKAIDKITYEAKYNDQIQQNHWILSNISFDKIQNSDLEKRVAPYFKNYKTEDFKPAPKDHYKLLENEMVAPLLAGKFYPDYKKEVEIGFDKITIFDFWYTSCLPCIKAIPHLNKLKEKYGDKIDIIGINATEKTEKQKDKIDAFLKRTPMNYPILLVDKIPVQYNIQSYPTLYILDKNGKVKFSKAGFTDNMYEELDTILEALIKDQ